MNAQSFLDNFHTIARAPGGVSRMRELVYFFAITGGLSRPEAGDSDANLILDDSLQAKLEYYEENSVRQGARKHSEIFQVVKRVPNHWVMVSAGDLIHLINGRAFKSTDWRKSGLPIIRIQNLNNATAPFNYFQGEVAEGHRVRTGDMLLSWSGTPGTSFGAFIWNGEDAVLNQHIFKVAIYSSKISKEYLRMAINASLDALIGSARGGVGLKHVTKGQIESLQIPLPPLEEQKRIVAKVDELMRLCDRLEAQQQEREKLLPLLSRANHVRFAAEPTSANLKAIFHESGFSLPEDMRRSILTHAIEGRLTKEQTSSGSDEIKSTFAPPFKLPKDWTWETLGDLVEFVGGSQPPKSQFRYVPQEGYTRLIQIRDFKTDEYQTYIPTQLANRPFNEDDVMIGRYGPPVFQIFRGLSGTYNVALMKAQPRDSRIEKTFLFYLLQERRIHDKVVAESDRTAGQSGVRKPLLNAFVIGLPPLNEQRKIVATIERLFLMIDNLDSLQQQRLSIGRYFAQAAIAAVTSIELMENVQMKPPKTEVETLLKLAATPKDNSDAPLATLLREHNSKGAARDLWQLSGLTIDSFYLQLKKEMANGWIEEDKSKRAVKEVEVG